MGRLVKTLMRSAAALLLLVACTSTPPVPAPEPQPAPAPVEQPPPPLPPEVQPQPQSRETTAIAGLMESARADAAAGRLPNAAASLERALRIEPRNPRLWQELARVRLQQGDYAQAESTAARSNSYAGNDSAQRAENQRLIDEARSRRAR